MTAAGAHPSATAGPRVCQHPRVLRRLLAPVLAGLMPLAVLGWGLRRVLPTLGTGLWGPADPFRNGDFNGGWWLWWASHRGTTDSPGWALLDWPHGVDSLAAVIPNPLDMLLLGQLGPPSVAGWNGVQLAHLVLALLATVGLARAAGAAWWAAGAAATLLAASPVLLHEVAGGRPSNLIVWPGLLALAALIRGRGVAAGVLAALQGVAYAWHGLVLVLVALPLIRRWRPALVAGVTGALLVAPYVAWLVDGLGQVPVDTPQVGYTHLPGAGLFGLGGVPPRFRLHPALLLAVLPGLRWGWRLGLAGGLGLLLAMGPELEWSLGQPLATGPLAWLQWAVPPVNRLHHPLRAVLLALPLLCGAVALGLTHLRGGRLLGAVVVALACAAHKPMDQATTYGQPGTPDFADLGAPGDGPVVDLQGMHHRTALALQTVHGRPLLEPLWFQRPRDGVQAEVDAFLRTGRAAPDLWQRLADRGLEQVWALDRFGDGVDLSPALRAALGDPLVPGVWALPSPTSE